MKALKTLIKLHQNKIDFLTKKIANLEANLDKVEVKIIELNHQKKHEIKAAENDIEAQKMLANYLLSVNNLLEQLQINKLKFEQEISKQRDLLRDEFIEKKRFEIVQERKEKEQKEKELANETKMLDEFAVTRAAYKKNKNN